jgi:hypothetical protein
LKCLSADVEDCRDSVVRFVISSGVQVQAVGSSLLAR